MFIEPVPRGPSDAITNDNPREVEICIRRAMVQENGQPSDLDSHRRFT
jgi:hypothetical protein